MSANIQFVRIGRRRVAPHVADKRHKMISTDVGDFRFNFVLGNLVEQETVIADNNSYIASSKRVSNELIRIGQIVIHEVIYAEFLALGRCDFCLPPYAHSLQYLLRDSQRIIPSLLVLLNKLRSTSSIQHKAHGGFRAELCPWRFMPEVFFFTPHK